jgi:hypothetical protein
MGKTNKNHKTYFSDEDFEPDHVYEKRKLKEARQKKANEALVELMFKEGMGG